MEVTFGDTCSINPFWFPGLLVDAGVGIHEAVAGGAAPHRDENVQLVGEHHVEAGPARQ